MPPLVTELHQLYPSLNFVPANRAAWSPKDQTIHYSSKSSTILHYELLHEVGHALLDHRTFSLDFELLQLEIAAWEKANQLAQKLKLDIDPEHIQNCLDTYRNWLYQRSTCPTCTASGIQCKSKEYRCINCNKQWKVSPSRLCRSYRRS